MELDQLNRELAANHLAGFWTGNVTGFEQNIEPVSSIVPHVWKWARIYEGLMKARELVNMEMAERRTVRLSNPGGKGWANHSVFIGRRGGRISEMVLCLLWLKAKLQPIAQNCFAGLVRRTDY